MDVFDYAKYKGEIKERCQDACQATSDMFSDEIAPTVAIMATSVVRQGITHKEMDFSSRLSEAYSALNSHRSTLWSTIRGFVTVFCVCRRVVMHNIRYYNMLYCVACLIISL